MICLRNKYNKRCFYIKSNKQWFCIRFGGGIFGSGITVKKYQRLPKINTENNHLKFYPLSYDYLKFKKLIKRYINFFGI